MILIPAMIAASILASLSVDAPDWVSARFVFHVNFSFHVHETNLFAGLVLSVKDAERAFDDIDRNDGGQILFDEFCRWIVSTKIPVD